MISNKELSKMLKDAHSFFEEVQSICSSHGPLTTSIFPPHNIIKGENGVCIQVAVAGYSKKELDVKKLGKTLVITGKKLTKGNGYIFKGISEKDFEKKFTLASRNVNVKQVELLDGILSVLIEKPEGGESEESYTIN